MSSSPGTTRWTPQSPEEREIVLRELGEILASHHFKNSKRYPALLQYVVTQVLDGHADQLKERTLGVEVFGRAADYDTNADPVVRFTAGEVRKRIAQHYHVSGGGSRLQIDLPLGSYIPEFSLRPVPREQSAELSVQQLVTAVSTQPAPDFSSASTAPQVPSMLSRLASVAFRPVVAWPAVLLIALAPFVGAYALQRLRPPSAADRIWRPILKSPGAVEIVIGNGLHEVRNPPDPEHEILVSQLHGAYNRVSVCDAVAVSRLSAVLGNKSKTYEIKEAELTSLQDLRDRSVILIGAYNNLWTMRLIEPLHFHFVRDGHGVRIEDAAGPQNGSWASDYTKAGSASVNDYAILARHTDSTTHSSILTIAGIGAYGTEAASEAVADPRIMEKLLAGVHGDWENKNLEIVIKTTIIHGEAGPAELVSSAIW